MTKQTVFDHFHICVSNMEIKNPSHQIFIGLQIVKEKEAMFIFLTHFWVVCFLSIEMYSPQNNDNNNKNNSTM